MRFEDVVVVDGLGGAPYVADVVIDADRIVDIERSAEQSSSSGFVLAPGFIDVHTHDDVRLLKDPDLSCKTAQGVTSVVVGNCGFSAAPSYTGTPTRPSFESVGEYLSALQAEPAAVNVATLVGHGSIRGKVMGTGADRTPSATELAAMADEVVAAMTAGAVGMSSGLVYEPGCHAEVDELISLASIVAEVNGIYTTHMRSEGIGLLDSVAEAIAVAEATGVRLQISHLKAANQAVWGQVVDALEMLDTAQARGVDVKFDQFPYTKGATMFDQVANSGAFLGQPPFGPLSPEAVTIAAAPGHRDWEGLTLAQVAEKDGVDHLTMADRIVAELGPRCMVNLDLMCESDVRTVMAHPLMIVGTDGVSGGSRPHARLHHTYPRLLGHYVRELGHLSLAQAVKSMTSAAAERFGFTDRGIISPGAYADLVVFDPNTIIDTGTYDNPTVPPEGIQQVWVNGIQIIDNGTPTGNRPGTVVTRG